MKSYCSFDGNVCQFWMENALAAAIILRLIKFLNVFTQNLSNSIALEQQVQLVSQISLNIRDSIRRTKNNSIFGAKQKKIQVNFHSKFCWKNIFGRFDESIYYIFQFPKPNSVNGEFEFNFLKCSIRYSMPISICAVCIEKKVRFLLQTDGADIRKYINDWYVSIACKPIEWKLRWWRKKIQ